MQCLSLMQNITDAQAAAENAKIRNSDITIETRPDYCKKSHIDLMLSLGTTRVELGVQTVYDDVYKFVKREHTVADVAEATYMLKDSGFAVIYHMMPGLMGADYNRDLEAFKTIFEDERFKPDAIKIYPTLVMPNTKLFDMYKKASIFLIPLMKQLNLLLRLKTSS